MRPAIMMLSALVAFFSTMAPPVAHAGFVSSRSDWATMTALGKIRYVEGAFDEMHTLYSGQDYANQLIEDRIQCVFDLGLTSGDLSDLVEKAYERPESWEFPPNTVLLQEVVKVCRRKINAARTLRGEEPLPE